ncbi:MAG: hypothetical protein RLY20_3249 [Verrucomicrobiota bacterium]|jgi:hypothetical protein
MKGQEVMNKDATQKSRLACAAEELRSQMSERDGALPVWVRAPKRGHEFFSGCSRPKLYEWAGKNFIRSVSIREPGRIKGVRLFHLASILAFIEQCEKEAKSDGMNTGKQP